MPKTQTKKLPRFWELLINSIELVLGRLGFFLIMAFVPVVALSVMAAIYLVFLALTAAMFSWFSIFIIFLATVAFFVVMIILSVMSVCGIIIGLHDPKLHDWMEAYRRAQTMVEPFFLASLLVGVFIAIGYFLLVIPGLYLTVIYSLVPIIVVVEGAGKWRVSDERSRQLIRGYFWPVTYRLLAGLFFLIIVRSGLTIIFRVGEVQNGPVALVSWVVGMLLFPFELSFIYNLYKELVAVKGRRA